MSDKGVLSLAGAITILLLTQVAPVAAQDIPTLTTETVPLLCNHHANNDAEYTQEMDSSLDLTEGKKRRTKPSLHSLLRRVEREWPRLLLRYAQPAVRGLLADQQANNSSLMLKTTLFRDNKKGLHLAGGFARNVWGEREARLQLSARF